MVLTVASSVGVVRFHGGTSNIDDVIQSTINPSTVTVSNAAINQHLFSKDNLAVTSHVPGGFHGSDSSESPAASAGSLVLDGVHDGPPVSGIGSGGLFQVGFSDVSLTLR